MWYSSIVLPKYFLFSTYSIIVSFIRVQLPLLNAQRRNAAARYTSELGPSAFRIGWPSTRLSTPCCARLPICRRVERSGQVG